MKDKAWILVCICTCTMIQTWLCDLSDLTKARAIKIMKGTKVQTLARFIMQ